MGFGDCGLGLVEGLRSRDLSAEFKGWGLGTGVQSSGFGVKVLGLEGLGLTNGWRQVFRAWGLR